MYNSTGLADDQFNALYERLKAAIRNSLKQDKKPVQIPTVLGIIGALEVTLKYLRRNRVQAELAESHSVSQSTISRAITAVTDLLADCLAEERPTLGHLNARNIIADKGYIGRGLHTPARTQPGRKLTELEKDYNQRINHIRWPIERAIAHLINAITGIIFGIL